MGTSAKVSAEPTNTSFCFARVMATLIRRQSASSLPAEPASLLRHEGEQNSSLVAALKAVHRGNLQIAPTSLARMPLNQSNLPHQNFRRSSNSCKTPLPRSLHALFIMQSGSSCHTIAPGTSGSMSFKKGT